MAADRTVGRAIYSVGGLQGDHCRDRIEHTVSHLPGVSKVDVDVNAEIVSISYDPDVIASESIKNTLQTLGYSIQGANNDDLF